MSDLVLFSGGCDSTLVLYTQAMNQLKNNAIYNRVTAVSINHDQVPSQKQQQNARSKIKAEFIKRELPIDWIDVTITQSGGFIAGGGTSQPVLWLPTAALYLKAGDTLYTGYHSGDGYWVFHNEAELALQSFLKVMDKKDIKIEHQLQFKDKACIIRELKERGLYDLCWYCEEPTPSDTPCGNCTPCKTHRTALYVNDTWHKDIGNSVGEYRVEPTEICLKASCDKLATGIASMNL